MLLDRDTSELIDGLVAHYEQHLSLYRRITKGLHEQISDAVDPENQDPLSELVHSVKYRLKNPDHLRKKLIRKYSNAIVEGRPFEYSREHLFEQVTDLGGYRILHIHTRQFEAINSRLLPILEESHNIVEGPIAKTWDEETKAYFRSIGVATEDNSRMYSSVHYLLRPNSKTPLTIELQVRTLADEIWGEIDHKINYPNEHELLSCREQIKSLARVTSSCSRLVDSIMATHYDWVSGSNSAE